MSKEASILIVDDDAEDLASLTRTLEALVVTIDTVSDPHEVLEVTRRDNPDVVILDALLPGLSGFDLCKQIKSDSALKGIQVLVITGVYLRQQYRQEALQQFVSFRQGCTVAAAAAGHQADFGRRGVAGG